MQPRRVEPKRDLKISPSKTPHLLKPSFRGRQQHRAWTISIERERARSAVSGAAIVCPTVSISAHLPAVSAGGFPSIGLPQSHSFNQHSGSSLYIFTRSDANVLRGCHIFIFTSANALGCLFQVFIKGWLLRCY